MVVLEPFSEADFDRLIGWVPSSDFLLQWAGPDFEYPLDREQLDEHLRGAQGDLSSKLIYKVVDCENGTAIGHIELAAIDRRNGSARVCRVLVGDPAYRGKGIGTVMMEKIVEIGFRQLGLHRLELSVFDFNTSAIRCYEKVEFVKEGYIRECRKADDEYWSFYIMAILRQEWESSRNEPKYTTVKWVDIVGHV